jgi:hypothetical protein
MKKLIVNDSDRLEEICEYERRNNPTYDFYVTRRYTGWCGFGQKQAVILIAPKPPQFMALLLKVIEHCGNDKTRLVKRNDEWLTELEQLMDDKRVVERGTDSTVVDINFNHGPLIYSIGYMKRSFEEDDGFEFGDIGVTQAWYVKKGLYFGWLAVHSGK